ncbi:MAG: hypothetical protein H0W62_01350 [Chitinophagales bacterium]|nr:hypothetical protein [Chitinophagales bacterium]
MFRIFDIPFIDILLILLAIRFVWPGLFGIRRKSGTSSFSKQKPKADNPAENVESKPSQFGKNEGKYIDYEEIK